MATPLDNEGVEKQLRPITPVRLPNRLNLREPHLAYQLLPGSHMSRLCGQLQKWLYQPNPSPAMYRPPVLRNLSGRNPR